MALPMQNKLRVITKTVYIHICSFLKRAPSHARYIYFMLKPPELQGAAWDATAAGRSKAHRNHTSLYRRRTSCIKTSRYKILLKKYRMWFSSFKIPYTTRDEKRAVLYKGLFTYIREAIFRIKSVIVSSSLPVKDAWPQGISRMSSPFSYIYIFLT